MQPDSKWPLSKKKTLPTMHGSRGGQVFRTPNPLKNHKNIGFPSNIGADPLKLRKRAKIRNRYNQVPYLTQETNGKVTISQLDKRSAHSQQATSMHR